MSDILTTSLLRLVETRKSFLVQQMDNIEYTVAQKKVEVEELEAQGVAAEKEMHTLRIIENQLEQGE